MICYLSRRQGVEFFGSCSMLWWCWCCKEVDCFPIAYLIIQMKKELKSRRLFALPCG